MSKTEDLRDQAVRARALSQTVSDDQSSKALTAVVGERLSVFALGPGFGVGEIARDFTRAILRARPTTGRRDASRLIARMGRFSGLRNGDIVS